MEVPKTMASLAYDIVENFISVDEAKAIKEYMKLNKSEYGSYTEFELSKDDKIRVSYLRINKAEDTIKEIVDAIKRAQDYCKVPYINYHTKNGWAISYAFQGSEVPRHLDRLPSEMGLTKKILRMNMIVQEATRGGDFYLMDGDKKVIVKVPERALFIFDASAIEHGVTKNLGVKPRINLSIDAVVDR
jgi:hypothetical protein